MIARYTKYVGALFASSVRSVSNVCSSLACNCHGEDDEAPDLVLCGNSALQDRRFEPMAHREVASLSCTVSLLCAFERAKSWRDWSVGVHGLIIEFFGESTSHLQLRPSASHVFRS